MKIEMTPLTYTNTVNGVTQSLPVNPNEFIFMNWEEEKNESSIGFPGGKNYTCSRNYEYSDPVYTVTEYYRDQVIKEMDIDVSKVDAHNTTFPEMYALSNYLDDNGYTDHFSFDVSAALRDCVGNDNEAAFTDVRFDYYDTLYKTMEFLRSKGFYDSYLSIKRFFDYYDKIKDSSVPTVLL